MEIDIQTIEKTPSDIKEKNNQDTVIISPFFEQQAMEKEEKRYPEQENEEFKHKDEEFGMDTIFEQPLIKMKNKNSSKNNKKIEKLELRMKELKIENDKLRKKNRRLRVQNIQISKQGYKWYQQNRTLKTKYQRLKFLHAAQASVEASSQTRDMSEDQQQQ